MSRFVKMYDEMMRSRDHDGKNLFFVRDIVPDTAKYVFLLESPSIYELQSGVAASGPTGRSMTKLLLDSKRYNSPLGILVDRNNDSKLKDLEINKFGIMNTCSIPMQIASYSDYDIDKFKGLVRILDAMRKAKTLNYKSSRRQKLRDCIARDLKKRLLKYKDRKVIIIPCGKFAQLNLEFVLKKLPKNRYNWSTDIRGVPHPSNDWQTILYQAKSIQAMITRINK